MYFLFLLLNKTCIFAWFQKKMSTKPIELYVFSRNQNYRPIYFCCDYKTWFFSKEVRVIIFRYTAIPIIRIIKTKKMHVCYRLYVVCTENREPSHLIFGRVHIERQIKWEMYRKWYFPMENKIFSSKISSFYSRL